MKTMAAFVSDGISTLSDLKAALQLAMRLEFATIPPYLCAQWSLKPDDDPDDVNGMIEGIVVQEMYHFAQVGNMLAAIGSKPDIAKPDFLVAFPADKLPGNIALKKPVDLRPLSTDQLAVFEDIEHPQFTPVGQSVLTSLIDAPASIGDFYDTIGAGFRTVNPVFDPRAHAVTFTGEVEATKTVDDALKAIERIKDEGEGTAQSPDQIAGDDTSIAHYYIFKQIRIGKKFAPLGGVWDFRGPPIRFPSVFDFTRSSAQPSPSLAFSQKLRTLMTSLESSWTMGAPPDVPAMIALRGLGKGLIRQGITPEFVSPADGSA